MRLLHQAASQCRRGPRTWDASRNEIPVGGRQRSSSPGGPAGQAPCLLGEAVARGGGELGNVRCSRATAILPCRYNRLPVRTAPVSASLGAWGVHGARTSLAFLARWGSHGNGRRDGPGRETLAFGRGAPPRFSLPVPGRNAPFPSTASFNAPRSAGPPRSAPIRPDPPIRRSADPPIPFVAMYTHFLRNRHIPRCVPLICLWNALQVAPVPRTFHSYISGLGTAFPVPASRFPGPAVPLGPLAGWRAHLRPPGRAPTGTPLKCQRWLLSRILL